MTSQEIIKMVREEQEQAKRDGQPFDFYKVLVVKLEQQLDTVISNDYSKLDKATCINS